MVGRDPLGKRDPSDIPVHPAGVPGFGRSHHTDPADALRRLLKTSETTPSKGLPPILPVVLYNGSKRWMAQQDIYAMVQPESPGFLQIYQPHLRYYLIDEGRCIDEQLGLCQTR